MEMTHALTIVADENIPYVREAFGAFGGVELCPGRQIDRERIGRAEVLLVRSVTPVNKTLLEGTPVRFVGTATIGTDHVDTDYLEDAGVCFASAPGSNAVSVGEYVAAAVLEWAVERDRDLSGLTAGVIGVGNVGRQVERRLTALGLDVRRNDPPRRDAGEDGFVDIAEIYDCDIITVHVPLTREGPYPTYHLVNGAFFDRLSGRPLVINSSRGSVVDGTALTAAYNDGRIDAYILDVWEQEPNPAPDQVASAFLATPHIAGYSFDGKVNGTQMLFDALNRHVGTAYTWDRQAVMPPPEVPSLVCMATAEPQRAVRDTVRAVYDIRADDGRFRAAMDGPDRPAAFDRLRKQYPRRREFVNTRIEVRDGKDRVSRILSSLGFTLG